MGNQSAISATLREIALGTPDANGNRLSNGLFHFMDGGGFKSLEEANEALVNWALSAQEALSD